MRIGSHPDEVKKIIPKIMRKIKKEYAKYGSECKYIYRIEIGPHGGIHIHLLINEIDTDVPRVASDKIVSKCWPYGKVYYKRTYIEGGFERLAVYFCKDPDETNGKSKKIMYPYVPSRNLKKPEKEVKVYKRRLVSEPEAEFGYKIDKESISRGKNPFNGLSFLKYTELRI